MKRIHIIGRKNHGKTTLVVELVEAFTSKGLRVGTIKHTHHQHELDTPGKDSYRHRQAGAEVVGIRSPSMNAVFWPTKMGDAAEVDINQSKYAEYAPMFEHCDVVLVEGDSQTSAIKVEVWRSEIGTAPLAEADKSILAIITDDTLDGGFEGTVWARSNIDVLTNNLLSIG